MTSFPPPKPTQSLSGYIRQHLPTIEAELEAGIRQEHLVEQLKQHHFEVTVNTFRTLLYRARERISNSKETVTAVTQIHPAEEKIAKEPKPQKPQNPLKRSAGFQYDGTKNVDPKDLI